MLTIKRIVSGFEAGILIAIGGCVFLGCVNKYIGAVLFSVALLCICIKGYSLFTGRVGFIPESHTKSDISALFLGLLGNAIATALCGILIRFGLEELYETAIIVCNKKLTQELYQTLIRSIFCGILMYLAVSIYKEKNSYIGILFCVPVFILSGFEHSIADMFYFSAAMMFNFKALIYILTVVFGNALGAIILPLLHMIINVKKNSEVTK